MNRDEACRREALDWMILLQERPDDADVQAGFQRWREAAACDAAWRGLDHVGHLIRAAPVAPSFAAPGRRKRALPYALPYALAAGLAALVATPSMMQDDLATSTGEVRSVRLADGSRVTLAPDSAIAVGGSTTRQVRLLRGTALFEVRHDAAHPFRVLAGEAMATDLGTVFEVGRDTDGVRIAVHEGLVRASCKARAVDPRNLRPGDMAKLDCAAGRLSRSSTPPWAIASWTQGRLVVANRPLREVVAALRPWHHGMLVARGRGMARHVTGVYDLRHPERALAALRRAHGVTLWQVTPWITVVTAA